MEMVIRQHDIATWYLSHLAPGLHWYSTEDKYVRGLVRALGYWKLSGYASTPYSPHKASWAKAQRTALTVIMCC